MKAIGRWVSSTPVYLAGSTWLRSGVAVPWPSMSVDKQVSYEDRGCNVRGPVRRGKKRERTYKSERLAGGTVEHEGWPQ